MSHITTRKTAFRNADIVKKACERTGTTCHGMGEFRLYQKALHGFGVTFPGWKFPCVIDLATGEAQHDNYNGRWGKMEAYDQFAQAYSVEAVRAKATTGGYTLREEVLANGSIKCTIGIDGSEGGYSF